MNKIPNVAFAFLAIALIILSGCAPAETSAPSNPQSVELQVSETGGVINQTESETILIDNCNGKADITQTAQRARSVQIQGGRELGVEIGVIQGAIINNSSHGSSTSKSIALTAPPGTKMQFEIEWMVEKYSGVVTNGDKTAEYYDLIAINVQIRAQRDLGCPGSGAGETLPPAPVPTPTPDFTQAPPTPTVATDTPPGTVLGFGEIWMQNGVYLLYTDQEIQPASVKITLVLENHTGSDLLFNMNELTFSAVDNLGNTYFIDEICVDWRCVSGDANLGAYWKAWSLANGQRMIFTLRFVVDLANTQINQVMVKISELSRIQNAAWIIPINR